jgi:CxxC-x17-CxxC domain-containing protein
VGEKRGIGSVSFVDRTLKCRDCGQEFVFTAGEQAFYEEKGFQNEPTRCRECRDLRKRDRDTGGSRGNGQARQLYTVVCADCGAETEVPFQPRGDRPVYCRDCFAARKAM